MVANGVLGTGLTFIQFLISLSVLILGTIAIKISFNFDVNKFLETRQQSYKAKAQNACVHFEFVKNGEDVEANSFFISPPGTLNWICQRCQQVRLNMDDAAHQRTIDYYATNIKQYNKQNKKFQKLLKKAGQV